MDKQQGLTEMFRIALYPDNVMSISLIVVIIIIVSIIVYTLIVWRELDPVQVQQNSIRIQRFENIGQMDGHEELNMKDRIADALVGSLSPEELKDLETSTGQNAYRVYIWMEELWKDCKLISKRKKHGEKIDMNTMRFSISFGELCLKRNGEVIIKTSYGSAKIKKIEFDKFVANPTNYDRIAVKLRLI